MSHGSTIKPIYLGKCDRLTKGQTGRNLLPAERKNRTDYISSIVQGEGQVKLTRISHQITI